MILRLLGWAFLLISLLGWSAWWVICNIYEFAPPLQGSALVCAWVSAVMAALGGLLRKRWLAWALACINGVYLLAIHTQLDGGSGAAVPGIMLVAVLLSLVWRSWKDKRPASLPTV